MSGSSSAGRGRGALSNPPNRFAPICLERDAEWDPEQDPAPRTRFLRDHAQTAIAYNDSPDIPYRASLNPYRGCEHGCAYCYARVTHEYLGFSAGLDFETNILVKEDAPDLLRRELAASQWNPQTLALSGVTDPYQPVERRLELTRRCLAVLVEFRNPVSVVTKNRLVVRDLDLLKELATHQAAVVCLSLPTLDSALRRLMEPRTSEPQARLEAITALASAGIPVGVLVAPVIPGLTDHEIPNVLMAARQAGAQFAGYSALRLPGAVGVIFQEWIRLHFPHSQDKVLNRVRALHRGQLSDSRFGSRLRGEGLWADQIEQIFRVASRKTGLSEVWPSLSIAAFRQPPGRQLNLFARP